MYADDEKKWMKRCRRASFPASAATGMEVDGAGEVAADVDINVSKGHHTISWIWMTPGMHRAEGVDNNDEGMGEGM